MDKIITMCHWRRPDYTSNCMDHLSKCFGIQDYTVVAHIDGGAPESVSKGCERLRPFVRELIVKKHRSHKGCNGNTLSALVHGFSIGNYVVHVEDDILLAPDALEFSEWASQFESDPKIFTIGLWRHPKGWMPDQKRPWIPGHERKADGADGFHVWGWATWKSRWVEIEKAWTKGDDRTASWDTVMSTTVRGNRLSLLPYIARANNIGSDLGTHRGAAWLDHWADAPGFIPPHKFERV